MHPQKAPWFTLVLCLVAAPVFGQQQGATSLMSLEVRGTTANGQSKNPSVSGDGRFVAFDSDATNLIRGDTNENSDVFVRDAYTGVTERASITWKAQEPRGDSECPAISDDGRYVAFRSNAWNMYSGGANLGAPRWDVYLRDRHAGTTHRLTVGHDGSEPDGDSECPSISADGDVVAFSSRATNLTPAYPPLPEGSSGPAGLDGQFAFVWSRATGSLRLLTAYNEHGDPSGGAYVALSGDGSVLAFTGREIIRRSNGQYYYVTNGLFVLSTDSGEILDHYRSESGPAALSTSGRYLVSSRPSYWSHGHLYYRDRTTDERHVLTRGRPVAPCWNLNPWGRCRHGRIGAPAISGDGRYVTFPSASQLLLSGANGGDQIFVWDAVSDRLRRISVTPERMSGVNCSVEPSLSRDGKVIAYRSGSGDIVGNAEPSRHEVLRSEWQCHGDECAARASCSPTPISCVPSTRANVSLRQAPLGLDGTTRFTWRWVRPPLTGANVFSSPANAGPYDVCVYAGGRNVFDARLPVSADWTETRAGFRIRDDARGMSLSLRNSENRAVIVARGRGPALEAPYLPLSAYSPGVSVQLHERGTGKCWGSYLSQSKIRANYAGEVSDESIRSGKFLARDSS